jgi:uncharacterized protein YukE
MTSPAMKYDFANMAAVTTDVNKQLKNFQETLAGFRADLTALSAQWTGGASDAANALGLKLKTQGEEIAQTVEGFVGAMQKNLVASQATERQNVGLFDV